MSSLKDNLIGVKGLGKLPHGHLTNLTTLNLKTNQIGPAGSQALRHLRSLTTYNLCISSLGNEGATQLEELKISFMKTLNTSSTQISIF